MDTITFEAKILDAAEKLAKWKSVRDEFLDFADDYGRGMSFDELQSEAFHRESDRRWRRFYHVQSRINFYETAIQLYREKNKFTSHDEVEFRRVQRDLRAQVRAVANGGSVDIDPLTNTYGE